MASKKSVFVKLEFGVMDTGVIRRILTVFESVANRFGGCTCFELWNVEVDGTPHDPDDPSVPL